MSAYILVYGACIPGEQKTTTQCCLHAKILQLSNAILTAPMCCKHLVEVVAVRKGPQPDLVH